MRNLAFLLFLSVAAAASTGIVRGDEPPTPRTTILAHATGENYGPVDKNIVVAAEEQKVFHQHSDFEGGGTWYDVFIGIEGRYVRVRECSSVGSTDKNGNEKMTSTERIFLVPVAMITKDEIELKMGNRIVLTKRT